MTDLPSPEQLRELAVPTLILAWVDDYAHPVSTAEKLHQLIPGAQLQIAETPEELDTWPRRVARFIAAHPC